MVSSCAHARVKGEWTSFEPFVLEMNVIVEMFDQVTLIVPTQETKSQPPFWAPYAHQDRIRVVSYKSDDGVGLTPGVTSATTPRDVSRLLYSLIKETSRTKALHVRSPAGISIPALLIGPALTPYRFAKYAGQWNSSSTDRAALRFQKQLLASRWWHAPVTVYGVWPNQPEHVVPFFTSMMTRSMMERAKVSAQHKRPGQVQRILFSGRLAPEKRVDALIEACGILDRKGLAFEARIVGDGPERERLTALVQDRGLAAKVAMMGHMPFERSVLQNEWADVLVLPSQEAEGWPKAVAEAMSFGVVPVAVDHGQLSAMIRDRGIVMSRGTGAEIATALERLRSEAEYEARSRAAAEWASHYSLEDLGDALRRVLEASWQRLLRNQGE